jgi:hypothetical protein
MHATTGDRVVVESERATQPPRTGVVEEVVQEQPPRLRVRWDDGRTTTITPSAGSVRVEPRARRRAKA